MLYSVSRGIIGVVRMLLLGSVLAAATAARADVITLGFDSFFADPASQIDISADGAVATLSEGDGALVLLSNIPSLGDPNIIVASDGAVLRFTYALDLPTGNTDTFHAAILNGDTGDPLGAAFEFFATSSGSGTVEFDLSSLLGQLLGLQFELFSGDSVIGASVALSGLAIVTPTTVSEPSTLALLALGMLFLVLRRRRAVA